MLEETEGWSLQAVAQSHWRMSVTIVRRLRVADGRNADTGLPEGVPVEGYDGAFDNFQPERAPINSGGDPTSDRIVQQLPSFGGRTSKSGPFRR